MCIRDRLDGVQDAKINFLTQKLTLEAADEDFDAVLDAVVKMCIRDSFYSGQL